ncbi:response regulator, partial [Oleiphilus sp. HI0128]
QGHIGLSMSMLGDGQLKIQVSDTGNGISEENQKRLFQDFVQVGDDTQKHMEGTGLGLAITRRIVERMEGDIQVYSSLGKGTTMAVYLPVELVEEPQTDQDPDIASNSLNDVDYSAVRVLIVDDVEMNCVMLEALLNSLGISNCEVERDGLDAVNRIKQDDNFDILLMDVRMPIMNGLDATRQIRELGYDKPVIALTANAFEEDQEGCLEAGMEHFLAKPLRLEDLQSVLNKALASTNPSLN